MDDAKLVQCALEAGAFKATVIDRAQFVLDPMFRDICKSNQCGAYGRCWICPPDVGEISALIARARSFERGLLYQTVQPLEDSFDIEGMQEAARKHAQLGQVIRRAAAPMLCGDWQILSCGVCGLCETCAKVDDMPCRHPGEAMPSMEGYGFDVYNTVKDTDLRYINGQNTVTYFGILLYND